MLSDRGGKTEELKEILSSLYVGASVRRMAQKLGNEGSTITG
jgi:hypothetical protein